VIVLSGLVMHADRTGAPLDRELVIPVGEPQLPGTLAAPAETCGIVLFAHGSGSGRLSPRNRRVADVLQQAGLATLLFDLLTEDEAKQRDKVFDIELLGQRLTAATEWISDQDDLRHLKPGYFGASTGAAAALQAAASLGDRIFAVVSRGGRPDLTGPGLPAVKAPTLLIVGGNDELVLELNREAQRQMRCPNELVVIPGATHLFEEPGALEAVAEHARDWFVRQLGVSRGE
jgi:putative phosphoribosyl transferase